MGWVLSAERQTTGVERLVLLSLANHAHGAEPPWYAWPSVRLLMAEANVNRPQTVQAAMRRLEQLGLVHREDQAAPDSRIPQNRRPNLYTIVVPTGVDNLSPGGAPDAPPDAPGGALQVARGCASRWPGGTPSAPQTSSEPLGNQPRAQRPSSSTGTPPPDPIARARSLGANVGPTMDTATAEAYALDAWPKDEATRAAFLKGRQEVVDTAHDAR